jgi:arginyl-tRNA synthetase
MIKEIVRKELDRVVQTWAAAHSAAVPTYSLEEPPKGIAADFASNVAMLLAKQLKTNPRKVADEFAGLITQSLPQYITKVEIAGPGFLNLSLAEPFLQGLLAAVLKERENFCRQTVNRNEKILIEFVSANPTGPLHIGHGRGAAIGDSLARIFTYLGYNIEKEYYLNDVGNQMNMLGLSLEMRYRELKGEKIEFPQDGYKGHYIIDIAHKLIDSGQPADKIDFKKTALDEMMKTIEQDLETFDVRFDNWFSESIIAAQKDPATGKTKVEEICEWLKEKGFAFEQEGALWFQTTRFGDDKDRVLRRSDGRYTYLASDVAYHKNKLERGYNKLINLWGADHHGYVARMKAAIQTLGATPETLNVILYQLVSLLRNGVPVAMSTRAGQFETLEDVVREVGKDACRFFFMLRAPDSQLEFDLELAKKQSSDNPVFYVQYVRARCCSIFKEAATRNYERDIARADLSLLVMKEEREMIKKLASFGDILELCARSQSPHHLTAYLMETADTYHRFYERCRVLGDDRHLSLARLALVEGVAVIIKNGLNLLGVSAPDQM